MTDTQLTICHASRHPTQRRELPDLVPGDLILTGYNGLTFYGGGLGVSRVAVVAQVRRELVLGRYEDVFRQWQALDARGRVIACGSHDWSTAPLAV